MSVIAKVNAKLNLDKKLARERAKVIKFLTKNKHKLEFGGPIYNDGDTIGHLYLHDVSIGTHRDKILYIPSDYEDVDGDSIEHAISKSEVGV